MIYVINDLYNLTSAGFPLSHRRHRHVNLTNGTADISGIEQVSLCAKYVNIDKLVVKEDFLQFVPTND